MPRPAHSAIDARLQDWAEWVWSWADPDGWPPSTPIGRLSDGLISIMDYASKPPTWRRNDRAERVTHALMLLPEPLIHAVVARYLLRRITTRRRAELCGIPVRTFQRRLREARGRLERWFG